MADLNALIAQGAQFQAPPDPFVQYGRMQQLEQGQQANQLNRMKMEEAQAAAVERNALRGLDPTSPDYESQLFRVNPQLGIAYRNQASAAAAQQATQKAQQAQALKTNLDNHRSFLVGVNDQPAYDAWRTLTAKNIPELASILPAQFSAEVKDSLLKNADDVSKQLTTPPAVSNLAKLQKELAALPPGNPMRQTYIDAIAKESQFAPTPPSDMARLIKERDALPLNDPNRALYDRQIKDLGATAQNARDRLAFDQSKFNYERANPGKTIKEVTQADGSTQVFAIDNRTGAATPVMIAGAPVTAPAGGGRGTVGVTGGQVGPGTPLVGAKPDSSKNSVSEQQATYNIGRILTAATQIKDITTKNPSAVQPGGAEAFAASIGMDGTANLARDADRQIVYGAQKDALDAMLYLATGAAYNKEQLEGQIAAYIPAFTDEPETVAAKKVRMTELIKSAKTRAGKAWTPEMDSAVKSLTSSSAPAGGGEWKVVK